MPDRFFDVVVLGGGPGGYTAAIRAAQLGAKVAIVEKSFLGGTCLNIGCIPTKALIHCASLLEDIRRAKLFGVQVTGAEADWGKIQKYKERCVVKLRKGVESLMSKHGIEVIPGHGELAGPGSIRADGSTVNATHIIIATGSFARSLPSLPIDGERVITSDHALNLEKPPSSLLVVGAGAIGCEFGYVLSAMGTQVTMVEFLDHALPMEDEDISAEFERALAKRGIRLHLRSTVDRIEMGNDSVRVYVKPRDGGEEFSVEVEKVLVSVGRGAVTEGCGFERAGIPVEKGFVKVDSMMRTGVGNIRAIGDVTGGLMLAHKASAEGILAVESIMGRHTRPLVYENIPRATYCRPEVASVGLGQKQAGERFGNAVRVSVFPFIAVGKAVTIGESEGFVKLIAGGEERRLVGAHAVGPHATDLIATAATAIGAGLTAEQFAGVVQAHPTLSECWLEAAHGILGGAINY